MRIEIKTTAEARKFLRLAGTKVALQVCFDSTWVFAEKADFIASMLSRGPDFIDYDGNSNYVMSDHGVLHIFQGTVVGVAQ